MRRSRKSCAARPGEEGKHAVSKFRRAVSMKIAVGKRYTRCNIVLVSLLCLLFVNLFHCDY